MRATQITKALQTLVNSSKTELQTLVDKQQNINVIVVDSKLRLYYEAVDMQDAKANCPPNHRIVRCSDESLKNLHKQM